MHEMKALYFLDMHTVTHGMVDFVRPTRIGSSAMPVIPWSQNQYWGMNPLNFDLAMTGGMEARDLDSLPTPLQLERLFHLRRSGPSTPVEGQTMWNWLWGSILLLTAPVTDIRSAPRTQTTRRRRCGEACCPCIKVLLIPFTCWSRGIVVPLPAMPPSPTYLQQTAFF